MSYASDMIDDLRDRLNDATDAQVPVTTKIRFLNRGMAAMFPRIFRIQRDNTLALIADTYEYTLPAGVGTGKIIGVEIETGLATGRYGTLQHYDIVASLTAPTLVLTDPALPAVAGALLRITTADRLASFASTTYAAAQAETYTGPTGTEELPVLYAMGLITARPLDDRMDYKRFAVSQQNGAVSPGEIMQVSQFWFSQFELLLDRLAMPFPPARN